MNFVAIDVETSNSNMASICQIGLARFEAGQLVEEWSTLVNPEEYFAKVNIFIHGIDAKAVVGQPRLPEISEVLNEFMRGTVTVSHTAFDRISIFQSFQKYKLNQITTQWLDSAFVVRSTWPELASSGYGLKNICNKIGYQFSHHNALEDAKAAGFVMLAAIAESKLNLDDWIASFHVDKPKNYRRSFRPEVINRNGNPLGKLFGEVVVFTGELVLTRSEAAEMASLAGCQVAAGITKKTTILVVGHQDLSNPLGYKKTTKYLKAEQMADSGHPIRIINEVEFKNLIQSAL